MFVLVGLITIQFACTANVPPFAVTGSPTSTKAPQVLGLRPVRSTTLGLRNRVKDYEGEKKETGAGWVVPLVGALVAICCCLAIINIVCCFVKSSKKRETYDEAQEDDEEEEEEEEEESTPE
mmetsp:Transcript_109268/g.170890  ORF Transcript_109268/g.170890 Transcript_109268/m.170890 type:complete len:122 (-) Transcript_109268:106-471(-)